MLRVTREDLTGLYLGYSELKTREKLDQSQGILIIENAHILAIDDLDPFGFEIARTLLNYLIEHPNQIIVLKGPTLLLDQRIFHYFPGLARRCYVNHCPILPIIGQLVGPIC